MISYVVLHKDNYILCPYWLFMLPAGTFESLWYKIGEIPCSYTLGMALTGEMFCGGKQELSLGGE